MAHQPMLVIFFFIFSNWFHSASEEAISVWDNILNPLFGLIFPLLREKGIESEYPLLRYHWVEKDKKYQNYFHAKQLTSRAKKRKENNLHDAYNLQWKSNDTLNHSGLPLQIRTPEGPSSFSYQASSSILLLPSRAPSSILLLST